MALPSPKFRQRAASIIAPGWRESFLHKLEGAHVSL